jgi:hypothetical protein
MGIDCRYPVPWQGQDCCVNASNMVIYYLQAEARCAGWRG